MRRLGAVLVVATLVALGIPGPAAAQSYNATVGGLGGVWYTLFSGLSELVKEKDSSIVIRVVPGGGLIAVQKVGDGTSEFGFGFPWTMADARAGREPFKAALPELRAVMGGFGNAYLQVLVDKRLGATSMDDLFRNKKGLKIAVDRVGTTDELALRRVLAYYKLSYEEIQKQGGKVFHAGYNDQASFFKDRQVDILFQNIAVPSSSILESKVGRDVMLLGFPPELMDHMAKEFAFARGTIAAGAYGLTDKPLASPASPTVATANAKIPDDVVYRFVKIVAENPDRVRKIHDSIKDFDPQNGPKDVGVALHPGAEKYYREKGWLR